MLGGILGGILGTISANKDRKAGKKENAKDRAFQEKWNKVQQANTLADRRINQRNTEIDRRLNARSTRRNFDQIINGARAAGLHPLAALGANVSGGIVGSVPSSSGGGFSASPSNPLPPSGGAQLGDAVGAGLDALLQQAQIRNVEAQTRSIERNDAVSAASAVAQARSRSIISAGRASAIGGASPTVANIGHHLPKKQLVNEPATVVPPSGEAWATGRTTNAQDFENEYGDLASSVYGIWRLGHDTVADSYARHYPRLKKYWDSLPKRIDTNGRRRGDRK